MRVVETDNLAQQDDRFELDARVHLRLQRDLRGCCDAILGIFHSHPKGQPVPSPVDMAMAAYPGWIWLITAFGGDGRCTTCAWHHAESGRFSPLVLDIVP